MNSPTIKVLGFILSVFVLINVASQIYRAAYNPYDYETVITYSLSDSVDFKGLFVREETPLTYDGSGVVAYNYTNGTKIAINSPVISVYANSEDAMRQKQISKLENEIAALEETQQSDITDVSQLDAVNTQLNSKWKSLINSLKSGDYNSAVNTKQEFLMQLNKIGKIKGTCTDFSALINEKNNQISTMQAQMQAQPSYITTGKSGYFVSGCDGYEHLSFDKTAGLMPNIVEAIVNGEGAKKTDDQIGKILDYFYFKVAGVFTSEETQRISTNQKVYLQVELDRAKIEATVESISEEQDGKRVVVFSCEKATSDYFLYRTADVKLVINTYTGIRIPKDAVRFLNNVRGVYAKAGNQITFKKIDVIYEGDDYAICNPSSENTQLSEYDQVVTKGDDLYDGKSIY